MAKSTQKSLRFSSARTRVDKLAKAAMSHEMLAAGLAAAAAAISASPAARRKIRDAGLDAADTASQLRATMVSSATKLGSLIAEAVAEPRSASCPANGAMTTVRSGAAPLRALRREPHVRRALARHLRESQPRANRQRRARNLRTKSTRFERNGATEANGPQATRSQEHDTRDVRTRHSQHSTSRGASERRGTTGGATGRRRRGRRPELSRAVLELQARQPRVKAAARV